MVSAYGVNGNVGHNMTKEEERRFLVLMMTVSQGHFTSLVRNSNDHRAWLCLMGLMETYEVIK